MELTICINNQAAGRLLYDDTSETFAVEYSNSWENTGFPLSPHIPFRQRTEGRAVANFIANLLPEGHALDHLSSAIAVSKHNLFGLFKAIGEEPTGAFRFMPQGCAEAEDRFLQIDESELSRRIRNRHQDGLILWDGKPRLSVAGVQQKLPIMINSAGEFGFGDGRLASTHILKFAEPETNIVLNEYLSMQLARQIGLPVPDTKITDLGSEPVLLVERFDRERAADGSIKRRHIIDGCQMLNLPPALKYEWPHGHGRDVAHLRTGASLKKLFDLTEQCEVPAMAKKAMIQWTLFNLIIRNADAHAKNISFFITPRVIQPAPFYDLINIGLHKNYAQELALGIGDEYDYERLSPQDFYDFCEECKIPPRLLLGEMKNMTKNLPEKLDDITTDLPEICKNEKTFITAYTQSVLQNCGYILGLIERSVDVS